MQDAARVMLLNIFATITSILSIIIEQHSTLPGYIFLQYPLKHQANDQKSVTIWILELQNSTKTCKIWAYVQLFTPHPFIPSFPSCSLQGSNSSPPVKTAPSCLTAPSVTNCHSPGLCSVCWCSSAHMAFEWGWAKAFELNNSHADFCNDFF